MSALRSADLYMSQVLQYFQAVKTIHHLSAVLLFCTKELRTSLVPKGAYFQIETLLAQQEPWDLCTHELLVMLMKHGFPLLYCTRVDMLRLQV